MIKTLSQALRMDKERFKVPKSVQQAIPIQRIWPDGIFQQGTKFSKTYRFTDINYYIASKDNKTEMFLDYSELLNSLDSGISAKITINNRRINKEEFEKSILLPMKEDGLDHYREEYNEMLLSKIMDAAYGNEKNPLIEKSEFILSVFEQLVGAGNLSAKEKSILDRCAADVYRDYIRSGYTGEVPTLKDMYRQLMLQPEEEARGLALSSELFINGSLNTFAQPTNVNKKNRIMDYDIRELGEQLMPLGMLVTLDSIFNRVIQNWKEGKTTWIFADEFYLLFRYEYSANFFYRLYKRIRKYNGFVTGLTQNVEELLKSDTARLMLANSEFLILLNQASTDREELAALLNISENQLSYITNVSVGSGLIRCSGNIVPFENTFPKNTDLYKLMTTKPGES